MKIRWISLLAAALVAVQISSLQAAPETYKIDPVHSNLAFKIRHLGISWVNGSFKQFEGTVTVDAENPDKSSVKVVAQAASVDTANDMRNKHLCSPDFFDVAKYPTLSFESTHVALKGDNVYEVTGNFTLHGVTKPLTFTFNGSPAVPGMKGETRRGGDTAFTLKRSDFGMTKMVGPVGDEVQISLSFEGVKI
ncbi:MAG: YceI family protein [Methylacidiphilales bacterium]|nr:YceI family protein [Candidatus Methylacidiphilales bacterium]